MLGGAGSGATVEKSPRDSVLAHRTIVTPMSSILLVADDAWVRNDVEAALSDPSTTLTVCDDPKSAAETAGETPFDVVVVDMQIKSMGGMAVTRLLHDAMAAGDCPPTPVVMLLDRKADVFLARRARLDAHLIKPFTAQALRSVLAGLSLHAGEAPPANR